MMLKRFAIATATILSLSGAALAAGSEAYVGDVKFSFEGPFGTYDQFQLQRGLQVFTEVCSACHGMKFVPIRTLADSGGPALPEDQVRAYAASLSDITDAETGEDRPRTPGDHFPASGLETAPDLSLMTKARAGFHGPYGTGINQFVKGMGGPEYIVALLNGYTGEEKEEAGSFFYENTAFPGGWIAMAPPVSDQLVEYADGHDNSQQNISEDVAAFLTWAAEPKMMARKQSGFVAVIFLSVLAVLLYLTNKQLWAPIKRRAKNT
jgi:ubiquinol-cytochrome c reductase cytochrome c1 subunit